MREVILHSSFRHVLSNNNQEMARMVSANKYGLGMYIFPYLPSSSRMCCNMLRDENISHDIHSTFVQYTMEQHCHLSITSLYNGCKINASKI